MRPPSRPSRVESVGRAGVCFDSNLRRRSFVFSFASRWSAGEAARGARSCLCQTLPSRAAVTQLRPRCVSIVDAVQVSKKKRVRFVRVAVLSWDHFLGRCDRSGKQPAVQNTVRERCARTIRSVRYQTRSPKSVPISRPSFSQKFDATAQFRPNPSG